jgi:nucleotide exchange factor SIL1
MHITSHSLLTLAYLSLSLVQVVSSSTRAPSDDLICPETDEDCYPRVFQPTEDFQIIKEGQDLPPGLHVRMDIWSGVKEARLNIPMEGETESLEGVQMEQAVVVIEPEEEEQTALRDQVPDQPPPYDPAGKILPPSPNDSDMVTFQTSMAMIGAEGISFDLALDDLEDLAHDIYYGVEIAKNGPVLEKLVCLTLGAGSENFPAEEANRDHKSAAILASAIQNNPKALEEVVKSWRLVMYPSCGGALKGKGFVDALKGRLGREKEPATLKAKVGAISGFIKESLIRDDFLRNGGTHLMLAIWTKKGDQWNGVRRKVAELIMDNFLDEGMGAEIGVWPKGRAAGDRFCETKGQMLGDECWEHHIREFLKGSPNDWAVDLLTALEKQRKEVSNARDDREL